MELLHEGKVKRVYQDPDYEEQVVIEFTDDITAGDGEKKETLEGKGKLTCDMTVFLLEYLKKMGIDTHYVKRINDTQIQCKKVQIIPVESVCRNIAAGSFCRRYGIEKGKVLPHPLVEFFLKDDSLHDPLITQDAIIRLEKATADQLAFIRSVTLSVNYYLKEIFSQARLKFIDFKLEFGVDSKGNILLVDEISGDTIRVWDNLSTSLDKDLFRTDSGDVLKGYEDLLKRVKETNQEAIPTREEVIIVSIMPKDGIKNPPGEVACKALNRLGFNLAKEVRAGKVFEIRLKKPLTSEILRQLDLMNVKLLSNPIAEKREVRL